MKLEFVELQNEKKYELTAREFFVHLSYLPIEMSGVEVWRISYGQIGHDNAYLGSSFLLDREREVGRLIEAESAMGVVADAVGVSFKAGRYLSVGDVLVKV